MIIKKSKLIKLMNLTFSKIGFQLQEKSPEILVAAKVVDVVVSIVVARQATPKVLKAAEKTGDDMDWIQNAEESGVTPAGGLYTQEDARSDRIQVYSYTGFQCVKLYAPAILLGAASITYILTSHKILRRRSMVLTAAYATLDQSFKDYRGRVLERFGGQVEKELRCNLRAKEIETTIVDEEGKEKKVKEVVDIMDEGWDLSKYSPYVCIFDKGHPTYMKNAEQNRFYLLARQLQANDRLKSRSRLFLSGVYEILGFPLTKAGAVVGWIYDDKEPINDNFVDFGVFEVCHEKAVNFVDGYERSFALDFDVMGGIIDALATYQTL